MKTSRLTRLGGEFQEMTSSCIKAIDEGSHTIQDLFCAVNKRSPGNEIAIFYDVPRPHPTFPVHFEIQYGVFIF